MDGNDLGMIARVFMFLLKGLKYVLKLVWFTGLWWFCVPLVVGIGYEEITGTFIQNNQIIDGIFTILWYACYVLCPLNFLQNIIRMVKKDRKFSFLELLLHNRQKKGFEAKLGGDTVALKTAKDLSGVVFGKSNGKYATMPESTDGHILIVGGAGSGKTAAVAIPTLMSWKERVFAIDIKGELYEKTKKARGEATIKVFNPTDRNAYGYDPFYMLKTADDISSAARQLAMSIIPLPADVKDPFWIKNAQNMLTGFLIYLQWLGESFSSSMQIIKGTPTKELIEQIVADTNDKAKMEIMQFSGMDDKTLSGVFAELSNHMQTIDILTKQTQKEIINIREDIEWNKQHEHIAKIERMLPKATEENKNVLLRLQTEMLKTYNIAKRLEPTTASAERTIECDGRKVPYFDYHKDKLIGDISFIRDKIESSLEAIRERAKTAEPQSGFVARRESIMRQEQPKQDAPKIDTAYAEEMARKLSALRSEFVKAMVQSAERTSYQPNPIYERQANEIERISKTISEQSRTIKSLQEERDKLGIFKGREKKELQNKIDNFERLRRSNLDKLGALGVSEPSKADEAVKEKRSMAAQEQNRAKAAMQNRGAKERAEEVKAAFLEAAKQIPADQRQEILDRMGQQKEIPTMGRLQYYQAEAEARRQLDTALKQEAQTRERNRTHDRDRGI